MSACYWIKWNEKKNGVGIFEREVPMNKRTRTEESYDFNFGIKCILLFFPHQWSIFLLKLNAQIKTNVDVRMISSLFWTESITISTHTQTQRELRN